MTQKNLRLRFSVIGMPETCTVAYADQGYIGFCLRPGPSKAIFSLQSELVGTTPNVAKIDRFKKGPHLKYQGLFPENV